MFVLGRIDRPLSVWPVTDVFHLRIYWTEVQSCFGRVRKRSYFLLCSVWSALCINLTLRLLQTRFLTNGGQQKEAHTMIETHVLDGIYMFWPDRPRECSGIIPTPCTSLAIFWV